MALEQLDNPPITEVACAFSFAALPALDPFIVGLFWRDIAGSFPRREVHPPAEAPGLRIAAAPRVRGWFISEDEAHVVQVQDDRFVTNWRKRASAYPRFRDRIEQRGMLGLALDRFECFAAFCQREVERRPTVEAVSVLKVDDLIHGVHWNDVDELAELVDVLAPMVRLHGEMPAALRYQVEHRHDGLNAQLLLRTVRLHTHGDAPMAVRVETTCETRADGDLREAFTRCNSECNALFGRIFPKPVRDRHFQGGAR